MLVNLNKESEPHKSKYMLWSGAIAGGLFLFVMIAALQTSSPTMVKGIGNGDIGLIQNLGKALFNEYVVPFEISSILFLSAMVGAIVIGKRDHA
jgi:NADH-quinone oxidoreductase subunit J